jgi:hypothetical protein
MYVVIRGFRHRPYRIPVDRLEGLGTYRHCAARAYRILFNEPPEDVFGRDALKTYNFYRNIVDPSDPNWVTIDGHMYNLWRGEQTTLDQARIPGPKRYGEIAGDCKELALALGVLPNQLQATLWYCYKRVNGIRFNYQIDLPLEVMEEKTA